MKSAIVQQKKTWSKMASESKIPDAIQQKVKAKFDRQIKESAGKPVLSIPKAKRVKDGKQTGKK